MACLVGIVQKKEAIVGIIGVKGHTQQTLFVGIGANKGDNIQKGRGIDCAIGHYKNSTCLLNHKQTVTAVTSGGEENRSGKSFGYLVEF